MPLAQRFCALGSQIGQVGGDQFPGDIGHVGIGPEMRAFGHYVVGQDQRFAADRQHRAIVRQPARSGVQRQDAQGGEKRGFVHRDEP